MTKNGYYNKETFKPESNSINHRKVHELFLILEAN